MIILNPRQLPSLEQSKIIGLVDGLNSKVGKVSTANVVYGTDNSGNQTTYAVNSFGKVDDVKVNGTSVVSSKVASITVPTKVSELTNDSVFVTGSTNIKSMDWYANETAAKNASAADPTKLCFFPA